MAIGSGEGLEEFAEKLNLGGGGDMDDRATGELDFQAGVRCRPRELGEEKPLVSYFANTRLITLPPFSDPCCEGRILDAALFSKGRAAHAAALVGRKDLGLVLRAVAGSPNAVALDNGVGFRRRCHSSVAYGIYARSEQRGSVGRLL